MKIKSKNFRPKQIFQDYQTNEITHSPNTTLFAGRDGVKTKDLGLEEDLSRSRESQQDIISKSKSYVDGTVKGANIVRNTPLITKHTYFEGGTHKFFRQRFLSQKQ